MIQEGRKKILVLMDLITDGCDLDLHDIPARYPNGLPDGYPYQFYDQKVAKRALKSAEAIVDRVKDLPGNIRIKSPGITSLADKSEKT